MSCVVDKANVALRRCKTEGKKLTADSWWYIGWKCSWWVGKGWLLMAARYLNIGVGGRGAGRAAAPLQFGKSHFSGRRSWTILSLFVTQFARICDSFCPNLWLILLKFVTQFAQMCDSKCPKFSVSNARICDLICPYFDSICSNLSLNLPKFVTQFSQIFDSNCSN